MRWNLAEGTMEDDELPWALLWERNASANAIFPKFYTRFVSSAKVA